MSEASNSNNLSKNCVRNCIRGRSKTSGGFRWMYKKDFVKTLEEIKNGNNQNKQETKPTQTQEKSLHPVV